MIVVIPMGGHLHSGGQQTFLNAMAVGKPVIVTDPVGASSYIEHGITGLLVSLGDKIRLGEALQYLSRTTIGGGKWAPGRWHFRKILGSDAYDQICHSLMNSSRFLRRLAYC